MEALRNSSLNNTASHLFQSTAFDSLGRIKETPKRKYTIIYHSSTESENEEEPEMPSPERESHFRGDLLIPKKNSA